MQATRSKTLGAAGLEDDLEDEEGMATLEVMVEEKQEVFVCVPKRIEFYVLCHQKCHRMCFQTAYSRAYRPNELRLSLGPVGEWA
jgi:hypothetical protein